MMGESAAATDSDTLSSEQVVYRAILRKRLINPENRSLDPYAYTRRPGSLGDTDGLSVVVASMLRLESFVDSFSSCAAVVCISINSVQKIGLDVIPDELPHALVIGLPYTDDDPEQAERLARRLLAASQYVWPPALVGISCQFGDGTLL